MASLKVIKYISRYGLTSPPTKGRGGQVEKKRNKYFGSNYGPVERKSFKPFKKYHRQRYYWLKVTASHTERNCIFNGMFKIFHNGMHQICSKKVFIAP